MRFIILFFIIINAFAIGINIKPRWKSDYKKYLEFSCDQRMLYICQEICDGKKTCEVEEKTCTNCVGTNLLLVDFFKNIGKRIVKGQSISPYVLSNTIFYGNFVTFHAKSIYNILTKYSSRGMKRQFKRLCNDGTEYPIVFASVYEKNRSIINFDFVVCESGLFELKRISALQSLD